MTTKAWERRVPKNFKLNEDEWPGSNVRKAEESFEDYKIRRLVQNELMKIYLKGRLFWDSNKEGTYKKSTKDSALVPTKSGNWDDPNILEVA